MREIKFRAWDDTLCHMMKPLTIEEMAKSTFQNCNWYQLKIMQFTGLLDKKGKEIYEGDLCTDKDNIVQIVWSENHRWGCKIVKTNYVLQKDLTFPLWQWDRCEKNGNRELEVIGNIYENPELLEAKQ